MLSYKVPLEAVSRGALVAARKGVLYAGGMGIDLKQLLAGKEGEVSRHFKISIQSVSQWVVSGRVPPARAVPLAEFLGLPDKMALLSPESTGRVNDSLGKSPQNVNVPREQGGNNAMMYEITKAIGVIEDHLKKLDRRVQEIEARLPPQNARKRKP